MKTILVIAALSVPFVALTTWAVVDVALKGFSTNARKAVWLVVASIPFIGCIVYFLFGRRQGKRSL